jgi:hypothetical protein
MYFDDIANGEFGHVGSALRAIEFDKRLVHSIALSVFNSWLQLEIFSIFFRIVPKGVFVNAWGFSGGF